MTSLPVCAVIAARNSDSRLTTVRRESPSTVIVLVSADPGSVTVNLASVGAGAFLSKVELSPRRLEELWQTHVGRA